VAGVETELQGLRTQFIQEIQSVNNNIAQLIKLLPQVPVSAPMLAPVSASMSAPVSAPLSAPVVAPVTDPTEDLYVRALFGVNRNEGTNQ